MKNKLFSKSKILKKATQEHLDCVNLFAAGIDIGSREHYVAVPKSLDAESVKFFGCFTPDLEDMADWLVRIGVTTVAMESTGVYWIPAFELLEARGLEVILVNAHHVKNVTGRKTDVKDCQWLQQLHTYGLLSGAFRPEEDYCILRTYMRQRENLISQHSMHIQHMQKSLRQMNLLLDNVVSDITSKTGFKIIRAILAGEREAHKLAGYRDPRCKNTIEVIAKSLKGNYRDDHLFTLKQAVELYDIYQQKLSACDNEIEQQLNKLEKVEPSITNFPKKRAKKKSKNDLSFESSDYLYQLCGVNMTDIDGLESHSVIKILSETGVNMNKWKSANHFVSWMGLSPNNKISGGKILSSKTVKTKNRAKHTFKVSAWALSNSKSGLGAYYRRMRSRLGAPKAINATARKLAIIFYTMLKNKTPYISQTQEEYEQQNKQRILRQLSHKAKNLGFELVAV